MAKKFFPRALSVGLSLALSLSLAAPALAYGTETVDTISDGIEKRLEQEAVTDTNEAAKPVQKAADEANIDETVKEIKALEELVEEIAKLPPVAEDAVTVTDEAAEKAEAAAEAAAQAYADGVQAVADRDQAALDDQKEAATEQKDAAEAAKKDAEEAYNAAKEAVDAAQKKFDEAKAEDNLVKLQDDLDAAQKILDDAKAAKEKAEKQYAYARVYEAVSATLATTTTGYDGTDESDELMKLLNELVGDQGTFRDENGNLTISYNPAKNELWKAGGDVYHEVEGADEAFEETVAKLALMDMMLAAVAKVDEKINLETDVNPVMEAALKAKFGTDFLGQIKTGMAMNLFGFKHDGFLDLTTEDQDTVLLGMYALYSAGKNPDGRTDVDILGITTQSVSNQTIIKMVEKYTTKSGSPIAGEDITAIYAEIVDDVISKGAAATEAKENVKKALDDYDAALKAVEEAQERLNTLKADKDTEGSVKKAEAELEAAQKAMETAKENKDHAVAEYNDAYNDWVETMKLSIPALPSIVIPTVTEVTDPAIPLASGPITRAQFIDYLWRHEGEPESAGVCTFADVAEDHEYFDALCWADENGVAVAYEDGTFEPDELVTVAAVREFLGNFVTVFGAQAVAAADLASLTGADDEAVLNCGEVLAEFFGEEYTPAEAEDELAA